MSQKRFEGTQDYVATEDLKVAVNAAIALERPVIYVAVADVEIENLIEVASPAGPGRAVLGSRSGCDKTQGEHDNNGYSHD